MTSTKRPGLRRAAPTLPFALGLLLLGGLGGLGGCDSRPRAPALEDGAVYHSPQEGFRFLVPTGWRQRAKTDVPPGKYAEGQMLVEYVGRSASGATLLEASLVDRPNESDLTAFLTRPSHGAPSWEPVGKPESIHISGAKATRYVFKGQEGKNQVTKEVVAFRRGDRTYFLTG